jgi:hypothetical protein
MAAALTTQLRVLARSWVAVVVTLGLAGWTFGAGNRALRLRERARVAREASIDR